MSRLGAVKMKAIKVAKAFAEGGESPSEFVDPRVIKIPEDGHAYSARYVGNLVQGLKENLPEDHKEDAIKEMEAVMGARYHTGGAAAHRLKRRLRRRLTKLDAQVSRATKNPMNSPNKALKRQIRLKERAIKMSYHLVAMLIRSTWRYRGHSWTPTPFVLETPKESFEHMDAYHQRIARLGTTIHTFERVTKLDNAQLAKVMAKIDEDRKAFKGALKQGNKLTIQAGETNG